MVMRGEREVRKPEKGRERAGGKKRGERGESLCVDRASLEPCTERSRVEWSGVEERAESRVDIEWSGVKWSGVGLRAGKCAKVHFSRKPDRPDPLPPRGVPSLSRVARADSILFHSIEEEIHNTPFPIRSISECA